MAVQITPTAIQHTGMTASPAGSVAAWQVTFQLDAEKLLRVAISIPVAGPSSPTLGDSIAESIRMKFSVRTTGGLLNDS